MGLAIIFLLLLFLSIAIAILGIFISIDFLEYLKRFHTEKWKEMSFERPFGIPREDFFFHAIKPHELLPFIFSPEDLGDDEVMAYKKKLKVVTTAVLVFLVIFILFSLF